MPLGLSQSKGVAGPEGNPLSLVLLDHLIGPEVRISLAIRKPWEFSDRIRFGKDPYDVLPGRGVSACSTNGGSSVPGGWGRVKSLMALTVVIDGRNQYDPRELEIQEIELLQNRPVTAQGGQIVPGGLWHCCGPDTGLRREEGGEVQRHPFPFRFPAWLKSSGIPLRSTASSTRYRSRDLPNSSVLGMEPLEKGENGDHYFIH